ncbi:serine hydrolase domain-containing protein [Sphingomonas sp. CA1-15]|uniref:Serine hydrolase domain-containing protein n=1 Tax=Sphingomonas immobilis TaxID=3063997 RepID=A0ABT8ZZR9_9SPHN|nr:serine hydrolase domain-containing protein [Sphingomonas sp. CA1-15]MDO7843075.1 serine hydrolase domain-containing protein [Sphingomonas sp. CA1-15]
MRRFVIGALAVALPAGAATPLPPFPATRAVLDGYVRSGRVPGAVAAIGVGDQPTVFLAAGRIAEETAAAPAGPDSLWRIYSMTKPVTAVAAMILIEEGKLRLDQPVADFIPAFATMRVQDNPQTLESHPAKAQITIRHLLTHTAGLGYSIVTKGPLGEAYTKQGLVPFALDERTEPRLRTTRPASLEAFANRAAKLPLVAEPGTRWSYSIGLDVMARVVEVAGGMPFDRFVQTRIFAPLGMTSTFFTVPRSEIGRFATTYGYFGDISVPLDRADHSVFLIRPSFPYGGSGLVSSARDYDRFAHMLQDEGTLDGVRILKPETARLMMSNLLPPGVAFAAPDGTGNPLPAGGGYGAGGLVVTTDRPNGARKGTYGWAGIGGTFFSVDPVRHRRVVVMVNYLPPGKWPLQRDVAAALNPELKAFP